MEVDKNVIVSFLDQRKKHRMERTEMEARHRVERAKIESYWVELLLSGMTADALALAFHVSPPIITKAAARANLVVRRGRRPLSERNRMIWEQAKAGVPYAKIGQSVDLTKSRIGQIVQVCQRRIDNGETLSSAHTWRRGESRRQDRS